MEVNEEANEKLNRINECLGTWELRKCVRMIYLETHEWNEQKRNKGRNECLGTLEPRKCLSSVLLN